MVYTGLRQAVRPVGVADIKREGVLGVRDRFNPTGCDAQVLPAALSSLGSGAVACPGTLPETRPAPERVSVWDDAPAPNDTKGSSSR
jgi:hypothetical protein